MNKKELWLRIKAYHFDHLVPVELWDRISELFGGDDASEKAFAYKLARKLGWNKRYAMLAVQEYKKFVYLGMVAGFRVTPSKYIDQVWHEHLLFTKAYREFCNNILKQDFDHHPELVPDTEQTGIFNAQYLDTLALYEREFGIIPPRAVWGSTKFDQDSLEAMIYESRKKKFKESSAGYDYSVDSTPLVDSFSSEMAHDSPDFSEFGGGDFGGGGAGDSWGDNDGSSDGSGADGGDGGGSCSSCSSGGCGGGCGGGD